MKVLVDPNVLLSYLLSPQSASAAATIVEQVIAGNLEFVLPNEVVAELTRVVSKKSYFKERIRAERIRALIESLLALSAPPPPLESIDRKWVRDPNDDYLIQAALLAGVDYLVSGDTLLPLKIRSPQAFLDETAAEQSAPVD